MKARMVWLGQTATTPAAANSKVIEITDAQWSQVTAAPKAVVKFYSPNCPYSRAFAPIYDALSLQYPDVQFFAVNVDVSVQQAGTNKVQMLPTVVFFMSGVAKGNIGGVQDAADFQQGMATAFGTPAPAGAAPAAAAPAGTPAATPVRGGTLVDTAPPPVWPWAVGGAAAVAALGTGAYFLFRGK